MKTIPTRKDYGKLKEGDTITFLRQCVGYETKILTGTIVGFNFSHNIGIPFEYYPTAHIKADCEYGSALPYNHTIDLRGLTKV